jgi:predicted secreted Zn-dependent protease
VVGSEWNRTVWRKSTTSGTGNCVEVAFVAELVLVRSSQKPSEPVLSFSRQEWASFLEGVSNGEFALPEPPATSSATRPA